MSGSVDHETAASASAAQSGVKDRSRSSSRSSGTHSPSPVPTRDNAHEKRSRSRSSESRSRSRTSSSSRSSRSRSDERRSRSRSGDRPSRSRNRRSRSQSAEVKRDEGSETAAAAAGTIESQIPTESVAAPPAEHQRSLSDEDDNHPEPVQTTQEEVVEAAVELMEEESQHSVDNRLEVSRDVTDLKPQPDSQLEKNVDKQAPSGNKPQDNSNAEPDDKFTAAKPVRKRRWGSTSGNQRPLLSVNISTDSLKGLIPEISADEIAAEEPALAESIADEDHEEGELESSPSLHKDLDVFAEDTRTTKIRRIVYDKESSDTVGKEVSVEMEVDDARVNGVDNDEPLVKVAKVSRTPTSDAASKPVRTVSISAEDPVSVAHRPPSPARRPQSNVVHMTGLVRPFTVGQLKELLGRTGTLVDDGFWIDSIKSHCYVVYETVDQAVATRQALHGKRWPASNPKLLGVEFRNMEEFEFRKKGGAARSADAAAKPATDSQPVESHGRRDRSTAGRERVDTAAQDAAKSRSRDANAKPAAPLIREWDRHKIRQSPLREREGRDQRGREDKLAKPRDKRSSDRSDRERMRHDRHDRRGREKSDKPGDAAKVEEEPPAKLLDDLFRKTIAMPCIYWLPLTDEQAAEKLAAEALREQQHQERVQQREAERLQRQKARDEERKAREMERDAKQPSRRKFSETEDVGRKTRR